MKAFIGAGFAALVITLAAVCPDHVREQAQAAADLPEDVHHEFSRQFEYATAIMSGDHERPDLDERPTP
ncbi:hypothetical protein [Hyphobacterium sp.]|uniref:hypothetical protein n=1 Tax=Hyphobacterium sp. TaxID=2004662 RepID=UPI003BAA03C3